MRNQAQGSGLVMIIALAGIGLGFIGVVLPKQTVSQIQTGQSLQCTIFVTQAQCSTVVVFPTPFKTIPNIVFGQTLTSPGATIGTPNVAFSIIANTIGISWINMPVAKTELMGNTNNEMEIPLAPQTFTQANIMVNCVNPSNSANARLWIQWADPAGTPPNSFHNLTDVVDISSNNCGPAVGFYPVSQSFFGPFQSARPTNQLSVMIRVMGSGGGGIGDNPSFSQIQLQFSVNTANNVQPGIETVQAFPISTTQMTITFGLDSTYQDDILVSVKWIAYTP